MSWNSCSLQGSDSGTEETWSLIGDVVRGSYSTIVSLVSDDEQQTAAFSSPGSGLLQSIGGLAGRKRPAGNTGSGMPGGPWCAGCDLGKKRTTVEVKL